MSAIKEDADTRRRELARIHLRAKELGLDGAAYRDMLYAVTRKRSAADLDAGERKRVLDHLGAGKARHGTVRASKDRAPLIGMVRRLLGPDRSDAYALGILKHMYKAAAPARLEWASAEQLRKVVAALKYDERRHV